MADGGAGATAVFLKALRFLIGPAQALGQHRGHLPAGSGQDRRQQQAAGQDAPCGQTRRQHHHHHQPAQCQRQPAATRLRQQRPQQPQHAAQGQRDPQRPAPAVPEHQQLQPAHEAEQAAQVAQLDRVGRLARGEPGALQPKNLHVVQRAQASARRPHGHARHQPACVGRTAQQVEQAHGGDGIAQRLVEHAGAAAPVAAMQPCQPHDAERQQQPARLARRDGRVPPVGRGRHRPQEDKRGAPGVARRQPQSQGRHQKGAQAADAMVKRVRVCQVPTRATAHEP